MSTNLPSEVTAYLQHIAPGAANELKVYERFASALKALRYEDTSSRGATAAALRGIQAELAPIAAGLASVKSPPGLAAAHAARAATVKHMAAAAGELAQALKGDAVTRSKRLEVARREAEDAERSSRTSANATTAGIGVAAAALTTVPVVGAIIAALLTVVAAILMLIGQLIADSKEKKEAEKEDSSQPTRKKGDDD